MRKCVLCLASVLILAYVSSAFAGYLGGDAAWALLHNEGGRLNQRLSDFPPPSQDRIKEPESSSKQKIETQEPRREAQPKEADGK